MWLQYIICNTAIQQPDDLIGNVNRILIVPSLSLPYIRARSAAPYLQRRSMQLWSHHRTTLQQVLAKW